MRISLQTCLMLLGIVSLALLSGCGQKASMAYPELSPAAPTVQGSVLERGVARYQNLVEIRLEGANDAAVAEIFGKVLGSAPGVVSATRYGSRIVPDNPQACYVIWRVQLQQGGDVFALQNEILEMVREVVAAGGYVDIYGIPYRYGASETAMLKGLAPVEATSRSIRFQIDRELARDREMAGG